MLPLDVDFTLDNGVSVKCVDIMSIELLEETCVIYVRLYKDRTYYDSGAPEIDVMKITAVGNDYDTYFSQTALQNKSVYDSTIEYLRTMSIFEPPGS